MAGLYIHIPFCKQACYYCDFHFSTSTAARREMIEAIAAELLLQKNYLGGQQLSTIYWGGGTPSLLEQSDIEVINDAIRQQYSVAESPEITIEANPDDLTPQKLFMLKSAGFNRLSIGIQSLDTSVLNSLNRAHTAQDAIQSLHDARSAGFKNISIDLMYALPNQTADSWKSTIDHALSFSPEHISAYALTIEPKTAFGKRAASGKLVVPGETTAAEHFEILMDQMAKVGYEHYEISNFCKPGLYSRHNSNYWKQESYLGVGPSAHSFDRNSRQFNVSNNPKYVKSMLHGELLHERELLTLENKINEYIFTTLRTSWGCDLSRLKRDFNFDLVQHYKEYLSNLEKQGLIAIKNNVLTLTTAGKFLADGISADLFIDAAVDS